MFPEKYAEFAIVTPKEGFDLSLQIDVNAINSENSGQACQLFLLASRPV